MAFVGGLITLDFVVVLLQFLDLSTAGVALCHFKIFDSAFSCQSLIEKNLVAVALHLVCCLKELLLGGIVGDQFEVALTIKDELLLS